MKSVKTSENRVAHCARAAVTKRRRCPRTGEGKEAEITINSPAKNAKVKTSQTIDWDLEETLGWMRSIISFLSLLLRTADIKRPQARGEEAFQSLMSR